MNTVRRIIAIIGSSKFKAQQKTHVVVLDVVLREGPEPPGWRAPDWSNLGGWRRERRAEREGARL